MIKKNISPEKFSKSVDLKKDIEALRSRLKELERTESREKMSQEKKEKVIKEEIKNYIRQIEDLPGFSSPLSQRDEAKEIAEFKPSQQVNALISLVFEKSLKEAVEVARNLKNPAILDEFHDALIDHFYKELVKRGVIKI